MQDSTSWNSVGAGEWPMNTEDSRASTQKALAIDASVQLIWIYSAEV